MFEFYDKMVTYLVVYKKTAFRAWDHMTPQQYATILITVALIGFISMRSKPR
jgi:hypothetical protein